MTQETVSWKLNDGRGTWDILSSCVLTLILCVWTSLHLNVPKQNNTFWDRFKTKALWVIIGVLAPELVVYNAWIQYSSAKYLLQEIQRLGADGTDLPSQNNRCGEGIEDGETNATPASEPKKHKWTMSHCFFAGMGGFAFDSDAGNSGQDFLPGSPRLHFTSHAILHLAKLNKLPNVSSADISDKSKADGLAKSLVCLQASWMLLQCIGRLAAKLPITLLEINTVGHCFCTLIIYLIWWNKPLNVLEPITVNDEFMRGFTSYAYMRSPLHVESMGDISELWDNRNRKYHKKTAFKTEIERLCYVPWENEQQCENPVLTYPFISQRGLFGSLYPEEEAALSDIKILPDSYRTNFPSNGISLAENEIIPEINFTVNSAVARRCRDHHQGMGPLSPGHDRIFVINLSRSDVTRWKLASDFLGSVRGIADKALLLNTDGLRHEYLTPEIPNMPDFDWYVFPSYEVGPIMVVLATASAAYGGLHLTSWNSYFPTVTERWLWMSSSMCVAFIGCIPISREIWKYILGFIRKSLLKLWKDSNHTSPFRIPGLESLVAVLIFFSTPVASLAYCFARALIVVEAFISLRQLPLDYYNTPVWSNLIPHL